MIVYGAPFVSKLILSIIGNSASIYLLTRNKVLKYLINTILFDRLCALLGQLCIDYLVSCSYYSVSCVHFSVSCSYYYSFGCV